MGDLVLQFLGDLKVVREGEIQALPPSKKTRALLAYLALSGRNHRREQLCELFWEIPDDPRGSLRWSLSKLRRLVDDESVSRIVADRSHVAFQTEGVSIDSRELQDLVRSDLVTLPTDSLIEAEQRFRGEFLEGLELPNFHEFSAWCTAERELVNKSQQLLLSELVSRLLDLPEQGIEYGRRLVALAPYDSKARACLIGMMAASGRNREAEQQYQQGSSLLKEIGEDDLDLHRALHGRDNKKTSAPVKRNTRNTGPVQKPLIGREEEAANLRSIFDKCREQSRARCVVLQGEAGIGKTHLLGFAGTLATQEHALLLKAGAFESEIVRPFALWNDALRDSNFSKTTQLLRGSERIDREKLFSNLSDLITSESENGPVVVLFDDVQWADESSAAALHYVLRMNAERPLWVLLAARDQEVTANSAVMNLFRGLRQDQQLTTLTLPPLEQEVIVNLIESQIPGINSELVSKESRGNPLLAIELARAVAEGNVAGTLNELVNERLTRLQPQTIELLQWASVLAPQLNITTLEQMTGFDTPTLEDALEQAEKSGILHTTEADYRFSHDLVTRSIYRDIAPTRRKFMHRKIAEHLEDKVAVDIELAAELARHASQSGDATLAARSLVLASRLCLRFFANDDAHELARRGLEYVASLSGGSKVCLTLDLKDIQLQAAPVEDWESAAAEYVDLAEQALDHGQLAHARLGYHMASTIRWAHGNWSGAKREILQAERVTRGGSEEVHIVGIAEAARCLLLLEKDLPEADAMLMEAQARSERSHIKSNALPAGIGMLKYYENDFEAAESLLEEARVRAKASGDRINEFQAIEYLTMLEIEKGDYQAAADRCQTLLSLGDKLRQGSEGPFSHAVQALCQYAQEGTDNGINATLKELRDIDAKQRLAYILNRFAVLDLEAGHIDSAVARATEALQNAEILERASEVIVARVVLAEACHRQPGNGSCREQIEALLAMPADSGAQWARERAAQLIERFQAEPNV